MRVLNDRDEKAESTQVDYFAIAAHCLFSALGIVTGFLGPLPFIANYARLAEPWPKVAALVGAVLALTLFQAPPVAVVIVFVFGLFVADSVWRGVPLFQLIASSAGIAGLLGVGVLYFSAQMRGMAVGAYWVDVVNQIVAQVEVARKTFPINQEVDVEALRGYLRFEGPFLYLAGMLVSMWLSTGIASHFAWIPRDHAYSSAKLRQIRFPIWMTGLFVALFIAELAGGLRLGYYVDGAFSIMSALMFISGTIALSDLMDRRKVPSGQRTVLYGFAVFLGFYFVLLVGAVAPWIKRRTNQLELEDAQ